MMVVVKLQTPPVLGWIGNALMMVQCECIHYLISDEKSKLTSIQG
ncbi:hypothetical protein SLEP1_g36930 [Rubroshorea leprosula]|uniref:Uncharacterized protein n=1 Tax=Rubroshorea leprosula TaxID=152421 RepID=A0AAV5KT34_9ROSI|nr:hypothetical protein SLEP1_g36930 [Rubroshorea leprosula]